ncbi:DUF1071 domain-containing protein [Enterococcus raffinosus]|uniref:Sak single strand annealing protein n=1 Tax=Enterococcus raffinosus TaxID=71452 RepID=UPI00288D2995|nr:DUF1071 domain-containing protein [Enterococcus raffinosus]MDT2525893.1 DUF1071 domain-containing protein [Enterococcus raffinosus]MDT2536401.1 DUF1071 domain-containing protein [Enterococcus raffinosus]MDT2593175.1 DUF1071 domain-containing protein [Enterococcus raffinosus]
MSESAREDNQLFNLLYQIDVKEVTEKRNKLTYLSWAWAWAEVSKRAESIDYSVYKDEATKHPYIFDPKTGYMVFTTITINGVTREMWLPVMDSSNKAMKDEPYTYKVKEYKEGKWTGDYIDRTCEAATMFDINKTIMRCLVKNLAMFGLGLYIFTGEDMPEDVSMLEEASDRSKKLFLKTMQKIADQYDKDLDWMILQLADTAKIPADDSKWTKGDLGMLKRGVGWLKQQLEDADKSKQEK